MPPSAFIGAHVNIYIGAHVNIYRRPRQSLGAHVNIWARTSIYCGARVYIWARHVYIWACHDIYICRVYLIYRLPVALIVLWALSTPLWLLSSSRAL